MADTARSGTIAAVSTPPGRGGVAVVRVSGPDSFAIASKVSGRPVDASMAGTFFHSRLSCDGRMVDDGLVLVFASPKSYTGEDAVEFHTHGGSMAPRRVLEAVLACGARIARRGEFTERAFLNGKLDLTAAEAVIDLIDAKTDRAADEALGRIRGGGRREFEELYKSMVEVSSDLEFALDISEDELPDHYFTGVGARAMRIVRDIAALMSTVREGKILREGALVVLAGEPNAGKSSLMNALLRENRAIVSDVAGTTRDSIEEWLDIDGWPVRLTDTAGLRNTSDTIEAEGVKRSRALAEEAEVVVLLSETGDFPEVDNERVLYVRSKSDLLDSAVRGEIGDGSRKSPLFVSSRTGYGLSGLRSVLVSRLEEFAHKQDDALESDISERQWEVLVNAVEDISAAVSHVGDGETLLAANRMRAASERIGRLVGKTYTDDLLDSIFSRFCVGK